MATAKDKLIESAEKLIKSGKYDKALKEYQKVLQEDLHDMRAKLKIGDLYAKLKDLPKAIKTYQEVAETYAQENFHLKAIAVYKTILKLAPTLVEVNDKLGDLYRKVGMEQDATNQYYICANYFDQKGMTREALTIRKKILAIDPENTTGRIRLAELMHQEGRTDESLQEYERVAKIYLAQKDRDGLIEMYEKILYHRPGDQTILRPLIKIYFEKRDFKKTLKKIEGATPELKGDVEVLETWAEALLEDRQVDASRHKFRDLYTACLEAGDSERSVRIYSRILQEFSDDQEYLNELSTLQNDNGVQPQKAEPHYRQDFEKTEMISLKDFEAMQAKLKK